MGTLTSLQICRWQCATLHKPAALHSFVKILTRLQWAFCFASYSFHDLSGETKGIDQESWIIWAWSDAGRNWSWASPKKSPSWITGIQESLFQVIKAVSRAIQEHVGEHWLVVFRRLPWHQASTVLEPDKKLTVSVSGIHVHSCGDTRRNYLCWSVEYVEFQVRQENLAKSGLS